jgi:hypothetical protein
MDAVQLGPREDLGYRRPPVTVSFEALRRRGLPEVLFVHSFLPEGVTICDINVFAAMIEEAYNPPRTLLVDAPDEHGNQLCRGLIGNGIWEWAVVTPGRRSGWRMTLAPERDGQRQATIEAMTIEHGHELIGTTLATFPISTRPVGKPSASNPVLVDPIGGLKYRRPPVTVSFDDLSQRGLPRMLFVNGHLPEGVTVCDINVFAAMIKEAQAVGSLRYVRPDELGNDQCVGLGGTGIWEWLVVRAGKPINGERYASPQQGICRILFAPEKDGKRVCTVDLNGYPGHEPEDDSPITFTIRTRLVSMVLLERGEAARNPADVAEAVDMALSWLANTTPAAAGLLRLLAFLPDVPVPLTNLLYTEQPTARLPGPEAAALIGPLLNNPAAASEVMNALHPNSLVRRAGALQVQVHPLVRAAIRAQLTAEESAHWQQAAAALVEAALPADTQAPASWPAFARLLPQAQATLNPASDGMERIARYLADSGDYRAARDLYRRIASALTADDARGPEHPRTLAARHELARLTGMAGDAAGARDELAALLPVTERVHGPDHSGTLAARRELARWTGEAGDAAGTRAQSVALWPVIERVLGGDHPDALAVRHELARWTWEARDATDARDQCAALLPILEQVLGPHHPTVVLTLREFPGVTGLEEARASARYQLAVLHRIYDRVLGPDHPDTLAIWGTQISWDADTGGASIGGSDSEVAAISRSHCEVLLQRRRDVLGPDHPDTLLTRHELARFTGMAGDAAGARDQFADLLPVTERVLGPDHPRTVATRTNLAYWTEKAAG